MSWVAVLLIFLPLAGASSTEEMRLEIIELQNRTAGDMIPILRPLLAPGGTVTGQHDQLFVRTTAANLEELRRVLGSLDEAPRNLRISVRQGLTGHANVQEDSLSARLRSGDVRARVGDPHPHTGAGIVYRNGQDAVRYRTLSTRSQYDEQNEHFVLTIEGQPAFIQTGQSIPYPGRSTVATPHGLYTRESIDYRDVETGFYVTPRVHGSRVTLEVAPQLERLDPKGRGAIDIRHATMTISGALGEWIPLGGATEDTAQQDSIPLTHTRRYDRDVYDIWVKVDEIR